MLRLKQDYENKYEEYASLIREMVMNQRGIATKMVPSAECARDALKLHPYYLAHQERIATAHAISSGEPACYVPELKGGNNDG